MTDTDDRSVKTYRYLRVTMVGLVVILAAAVIRQLWADSGQLEPSISDYYYTPVRQVFVAALVAIGVCLVALQGNTEWEDTFLNIAGVLAPVVAFVPTPARGACVDGAGVPAATADAIANNVLALLVGGLAGLIAAYVIVGRSPTTLAVRQPVGGGLAIAAVLWLATASWFAFGRGSFECGAHYTAAITMFVFIVVAVAWNAWGVAGRSVGLAPRNAYGKLALLMAATAVVLGGLTWAGALPNGIFWLEAALITLFAVFWILQSRELWTFGVRDEHGQPAPSTTAP